MFAEIWDESFRIWDLNSAEKENYINMISCETTKVMVAASTTDFLPWYNDSVYKPYFWICPISAYSKFWNIFTNFPIDYRTKISFNILDNIFSKIENKEYLRIFRDWCSKGIFNKNC
jgi:hypothetical protein